MFSMNISNGDSYSCRTSQNVLKTLDDRLRVILRVDQQVDWKVNEPSGLQHTGQIDVRQAPDRYNEVVTLQLNSLKEALHAESATPLQVITTATEF